MKFIEFTARGTAYYPDASPMEGGFLDRLGFKLCTLQDFLLHKVPFVSCAMDTKVFAYGTQLLIKELNEKYKVQIVFRVVDTGGAFKNQGLNRIDICVKDKIASYDKTINGQLSIIAQI